MAEKFEQLNDKHIEFIGAQHIYFVGTAGAEGFVNVSPKGMDSFRVIDSKRVAWLNLTGSGNETAAHIQELNRMTLMFCAFEGSPLILRLYGSARVIHRHDADWETWYALFTPLPGARQIFDMQIDLIQTSCGMGVPLFDYAGDRKQLVEWARRKGDAGLKRYQQEKNRTSLDGKPTYVLANTD